MDWSTANAWAAGLNFNGLTGWRLPTVTDTGTPGCNFAYSGTDCGYNVDTATGEMASMFYDTLGNLGSGLVWDGGAPASRHQSERSLHMAHSGGKSVHPAR